MTTKASRIQWRAQVVLQTRGNPQSAYALSNLYATQAEAMQHADKALALNPDAVEVRVQRVEVPA